MKTKRIKQDLETNWNVKPICDVRGFQQSLEFDSSFQKQLHSSLYAGYQKMNCFSFLCLILWLGEARVSMTDD